MSAALFRNRVRRPLALRPVGLRWHTTPGQTRAEMQSLNRAIEGMAQRAWQGPSGHAIPAGFAAFVGDWREFYARYASGVQSWAELFVSERGEERLREFAAKAADYDRELARRAAAAAPPRSEQEQPPQIPHVSVDPGPPDEGLPWGTVAAVGGGALLLVLVLGASR